MYNPHLIKNGRVGACSILGKIPYNGNEHNGLGCWTHCGQSHIWVNSQAPVIELIDEFPDIKERSMGKGYKVDPQFVGPDFMSCKLIDFEEGLRVAKTAPSGMGHTSSVRKGT